MTRDGACLPRLGRLRFDFAGLGSSDGELANTHFSSNVEDPVRAADHLRMQFEAPALLIGHSLGDAAIRAAAHCVPTKLVEIAGKCPVHRTLEACAAVVTKVCDARETDR